jgi:PhzF family phenazine biosynthesis protein
MVQRRFIQCDVFTSTATKGNGLAVVIDAAELTDDQMQGFAAWTNLAETTFLLPPSDPKADYKVRIFTPAREMPFAGHPTLGSCAAWLKSGHTPKDPNCVVQECQIGLVQIDQSGKFPAFIAPKTNISPLPAADLDRLTTALGLTSDIIVGSSLLDNGPVWQVLELPSAQDVLAVDSGKTLWPEFVGVSLIGAHPQHHECDFEVRNISPSSMMSEDPITGSLNAALAHWLQSNGRLNRKIVMSQGTNVNRTGRVHIRVGTGETSPVYIGGETQIVIEGLVDI